MQTLVWNCLYWYLWQSKVIILGVILYMIAYWFVPDFATFSLTVLPLLFMGGNLVLARRIYDTCGKPWQLPTKIAVEIVVYTIATATFGIVLTSRLMQATSVPIMSGEKTILVTIGALFLGAVLGLIELVHAGDDPARSKR